MQFIFTFIIQITIFLFNQIINSKDGVKILDFIREQLKNELAQLENELENVLNSENNIIQEVGRYVLLSGGKRIRPAIVFTAGKLFNGNIATLNKTAAALELIHTATLIHDDVVDHSEIRRGNPTVRAKWGDEIAILVADYFFSNAFNLALDTLKPEVLRIITKVTNKMCEGELFQFQKRDTFFSIDDYYTLIEAKTAHLFSACSSLGALISQASPDYIQILHEYGFNFGMAFQITDDVLDYIGKSDKLGKSIGNDLKEGKQTLPFIYTLQNASREDKNKIMVSFKNGRDFDYIFKFIKKYGGIDFSMQKAKIFSDSALKSIKKLPQNQFTKLLEKLSLEVTYREY